MKAFYALWILNVILVIDWAKNRRPLSWLFALICLGPLGSFAYLIYYYESINFPIEIAKTVRQITGKKVLKTCPRCGMIGELKPHRDGRQEHFMCQLCIERTFLEPHDASEAIEAAQKIIGDTP